MSRERGPGTSKGWACAASYHSSGKITFTIKEYALKPSTDRNPYTKLIYTQSPVVAFVEIDNENGLLHA